MMWSHRFVGVQSVFNKICFFQMKNMKDNHQQKKWTERYECYEFGFHNVNSKFIASDMTALKL